MSVYSSAPGVAPAHIGAYPRRRRGFMNDTRLASLDTVTPAADRAARHGGEPRYVDFLLG
ncbi:hypothetical protein C8E83_1965 [Frondihabitans australicus]|uniref:Uncharacterized protein n=1 Tax=Frondihabitans australicus TaxID=386892 RepID=A0A495IFW7_9MICO|nr:hypothetical protein C8E83_1965 [Frondihabitans australicus]